MSDILTAPYVLQYNYKRSTGTVIGRFFSALRDGRIEGVRTKSGRVLVPPPECDPETGESCGDFVTVGPGGTVTAWTWVATPRPQHPLQTPFAWALIRLDGADTALLHAVEASAEAAMRTGLRVRPRFSSNPKGEMRDLVCFEAER